FLCLHEHFQKYTLTLQPAPLAFSSFSLNLSYEGYEYFAKSPVHYQIFVLYSRSNRERYHYLLTSNNDSCNRGFFLYQNFLLNSYSYVVFFTSFLHLQI